MKGKCRSLLATVLVLALALIVTMPAMTGSASAVDLDAACSLTVKPGGAELAEDLEKANVVLDVYQIAEAKAVPGIDTYQYELLPDYAGLTIGEDPDDEAWMALAQEAAKIALNTETVLPSVVGSPAGAKIENLKAGLYLLIARGADVEEYVTSLEEEDGTELIATRANSYEHIYTFLPELISLPTKEPDAEGHVSTSNPGDWIYDAEVTLKPRQTPRLGSLEIIKGLEGYAPAGAADFVFRVEAVLEGRNVFSNVYSMNFTEAGTKSLQIDGIPVGSTVTVTEVYSGAGYRLVSANDQEAVIEAEEIASVEFVNTPTDEHKDGGSITNSFTYTEGRWQWQAVSDNT